MMGLLIGKMYEILLVMLSLLAGWGVVKITREEVVAGRKYFQAICLGALLILTAFILVQGLSWMLLIGVLLGLGLELMLKQPYFYFGLLGMMTAWGFSHDGFVLLVGVFSIGYCSLSHYKLSWRWLGLAGLFFLVPYVFLLIPSSAIFFSFYFSIFYGVAIGGFVHVARGLYSGT